MTSPPPRSPRPTTRRRRSRATRLVFFPIVALLPAGCPGADEPTSTATTADSTGGSTTTPGGRQPTTVPATNPSTEPGDTPSTRPTPDPDLVAGPAPFAVAGGRAIRVDEVRRVGDDVSVDLTIGQTEPTSPTFFPDDVDVTTNTGLDVPVEGQERDLGTNSVTTLTLDVPLPEASVRELRLAYGDLEVVAEVPPEDGRRRWEPAPRRQTGIPPTVLRDDSIVSVVPGTVRTEGLVTEVTVEVLVDNGFAPGLCFYGDCVLRDAAGTNYPLLGSGVEDLGSPSRSEGTLRFLGEIPPDQTELTVVLEGSGGCSGVCADANFELPVTLPRVEDTPARAVAGGLVREPIDLGNEPLRDPETGATLRLVELLPLSDHVQLRVTARGGQEDLQLSERDAGLVEQDGYRHELLAPVEAPLVVPANGRLDTTLVFASPLPAAATTLQLQLGPDLRLTTPIDVPALPDDAKEPAGAAPPVEDGPDTASEQPTPPAPAPDPTTGVVATVDVRDLPVTSLRRTATVRSSIEGVTAGGTTAGAEVVEPGAAAEAERSLEDLGAERTPDGLVVTLPETVTFDFDSDELLPEADATVATVAEVLAYYDRAAIGVEGHTDGKGQPDYNQDLSERRAEAVAVALADAGIDRGRMEVVGYGMDRPIAPNTTADGEDDPEGRARNRRVEIVLREQ